MDVAIPLSSQITLPSTEGPSSPIDPGQSFKTEANDERVPSSAVIPSSLTPPPSSQVPTNPSAPNPLGYAGSQRTAAILSPPVTGLNTNIRREAPPEYSPPSPTQVVEAPPDQLRAMLQAAIAEQTKLKMETLHHKLQYNLLKMQANEDAQRAEVEHEMTRREVEALRQAEHSRQARRELSTASESTQAKYLQLRHAHEEVLEELDSVREKYRLARKVIQTRQATINELEADKETLLNRLRENREHFHHLCSPGGMFHGALTPRTHAELTPAQYRATPRQTPKSAHREVRHDRTQSHEGLTALLHVISRDDNSGPSTPTNPRAAPRNAAKHVRNVQSMSSLPTTPTNRTRGELLPSVDLVPQTEPPHRYGSRFALDAPRASDRGGGRSRESTISADENTEHARQDNQALAIQALTMAQQTASSFASRASRGSRRHPADDDEEDEVFESQASQAASEMLRRDPRESFEVASSVGGSRDGTPAPAEKTSSLQAKLFGGLNKGGVASEKRKFNDAMDANDQAQRELLASPTKKARVVGGMRDERHRVGLGIQYSQEA